MQYRKFGNTGAEVSALGFGCMRLPVLEDGSVDEAEAISIIRHAIDEGVNYIDTAYPYHGGQSELVVGKALQDGYREKVHLATKLPLWSVHEEADFGRLLNEQLQKLKTDHIDFYLLHAMGKERLEQVVKPLHLIEHMKRAKADGRIRHIGFSFHDSLAAFKEIVDYTDAWEFCQIQYNYININDQAGTEGATPLRRGWASLSWSRFWADVWPIWPGMWRRLSRPARRRWSTRLISSGTSLRWAWS